MGTGITGLLVINWAGVDEEDNDLWGAGSWFPRVDTYYLISSGCRRQSVRMEDVGKVSS